MHLVVKRTRFSSKSTIGEMTVDGALLCYTLEDTVRKVGEKVFGKTAIPAGRYRCAVDYSAKFKSLMVRVFDVPGFDGILIHRGNTEADSSGCILVGTTPGVDTILDSVIAYGVFCRKICLAVARKEDITLEVINGSVDLSEPPKAAA